jgi:Fe-S cluster biogenesis protein NfuA
MGASKLNKFSIHVPDLITMDTLVKRPVIIYAESTPNPSAMKFVSNSLILPSGATVEYKTPEEAKSSPLAKELFLFSFVKQVFISGNYITIIKNDSLVWEDVTNHIRDFIRLFLEEGKPAVIELPVQIPGGFTEHITPETELEIKIIEILEEYIRPAVEQDGGLITFKSYKEGIVTVQMKGSCSGCPSSTLTLKAGIEGLLKRMIPEVKQVVSEAA